MTVFTAISAKMAHDVLIHALYGGIFAITGIIVTTKFCQHWYHQLAYGIIAVLAEAFVMVNTVG